MVEQNLGPSFNKTQFARHLRKVLTALYDPAVLRTSPLVKWFDVAPQHNAALRLRRILTEAIESLRPNETTPYGSRTWRVYQILRRRYTEQLTQHEVATDLGLSVRQLQREEKLAREVLADLLWRTHDLQSRTHELTANVDGESTQEGNSTIPTRAQELAYLRDAAPPRMIDIEGLVRDVLQTLYPLMASTNVEMIYTAQHELPRILASTPILRQALLNVISIAIRRAAGNHVQLEVREGEGNILIQIEVKLTVTTDTCDDAESLEMAQDLIQLCHGQLTLSPDTACFAAEINLPVAQQITVLGIDDNADVLQLFNRYLAESQYRFVGTQDADRGLALVDEIAPQIIILDVMMPDRDGWTLLGQFREHPKTADTPVIICSILSQEPLALTLGAAAFIRKPIKQDVLLSTLDAQLTPTPQTPA